MRCGKVAKTAAEPVLHSFFVSGLHVSTEEGGLGRDKITVVASLVLGLAMIPDVGMHRLHVLPKSAVCLECKATYVADAVSGVVVNRLDVVLQVGASNSGTLFWHADMGQKIFWESAQSI